MKPIPALVCFLLVASAPLGAAVAPYSNDFSGAGSNTALTELNDSHWALNSGVYRYTFTSTTVAASPASVPITNLVDVAFKMETRFTVTSTGTLNGVGQTLGFGLFGASAGFSGSNASSAYYLADFQYANSATANVGTLRILTLGSSSTDITAKDVIVDANPDSSTLAVVLGTTYTLRVEGSYTDDSVLNLKLGLFDAIGTTQIGSYATYSDPTPLTGGNFGYRNRTGLGGGASVIDFDNLSITSIPEPSAALPLGFLALLGSFALRRGSGKRA